MMQSQHELQALLPWYVNGTLDVDTFGYLEVQLEQSSLLQAEVAWLRLLRTQIRDVSCAEVSPRSTSAGLDTLMALIHGEQSGKVAPLRRRFTAWITAARQLPLSMGIAAAVVLSQAVIIGALLDRPALDEVRMLSGGAMASGQILQVTFKPTATEFQIRAVMSNVQGEIVAGPGALGVYAVRVPERQGQLALEKLRNESSIVDSVALLPSR